MNINSKNFDKIEAYLFNQMTAEEKNNFEAEVEVNTTLAKELKFQKAEHQAMKLLLRDKLKNQMSQWHNEVKVVSENPVESVTKVVKMDTTRRNRFFRLSLAASVLLVIGLFANFWVNDNLSDAALAGDYFKATYTARTGGTVPASSEVLAPGLEAMEAENYTKAVELFSQVTDGNYQETALILKGESYFQLEEYQNSVEVFQEVITNNATPLNVEKAEWKLLLSQLIVGNDDTSETLKNTILNNPDHSYYPQAVELDEKQAHFLRRLFIK